MSEESKSEAEINEEARKARKNFEEKLKQVAPGPLDGRNELRPVFIDAFTIEDAWRQCLAKVLKEGYVYRIEKGSYEGNYRLEFDDIHIRIRHPENRPLAPIMPEGFNAPPTSDEKIAKYAEHYLLGSEKTGNEEYTYGERMVNPKSRLDEILDVEEINKIGIDLNKLTDDKIKILYPNVLEVKREMGKILVNNAIFKREIPFVILKKEIPYGVNSVEEVIKNYKTKGFGSNQEILQVGAPADIILSDPPCLRHIDTRVRYTGKFGKPQLHFFVYFRSWDLWGGFPENLGGIQLTKEYMADSIGIEPGETLAWSKGLHIYQYVGELVEALAREELKITNKK